MYDELKAILAKRRTLHPEDDIQIENCWKEEVSLLTNDIDKSIDFIRNHISDDELYWLSEVFDDVVHIISNSEFVETIIRRAANIHDEQKKLSVLSEAEYAKKIIENDTQL